jgi:hypothetical protein
VPVTAPELELKATYGLAAPEEYQLPPPDAQWTAEVYQAFDITKMPSKEAPVSITLSFHVVQNNFHFSIHVRD